MLGSSASCPSSSSPAGTALDQLHPGGRCTAPVSGASSLPVPVSEPRLTWAARQLGAGWVLPRGCRGPQHIVSVLLLQEFLETVEILSGNKPRGFSQRLLQVFLRTRECHMPAKSRPLSLNLGSHKPQLPAWVKICPIWLIIAGVDFREAYLTQLLSAPLESQWEIPREEC